jgi:hypothetical protein
MGSISSKATELRQIMSPAELQLLELLDAILNQDNVRAAIDPIANQVEQELMQNRSALMAWQPVPLSVFAGSVQLEIQSSWVFVLRAGAMTGAERHPNSHQRVMSYGGRGNLQTMVDGQWRSSHSQRSSDAAPEAVGAIPVNDGESIAITAFFQGFLHSLPQFAAIRRGM